MTDAQGNYFNIYDDPQPDKSGGKMSYIDKIIHEIAEEMAIKESKRTKFLLGFFLGSFVGLIFWAAIIAEFYTFAPIK